MNLMDYLVAAPEMTLLSLLCVVLVVDLFIDDEHRALTFWVSMLALAGTLAALFWTMPEARTVIFSGSYVSDSLSQSFQPEPRTHLGGEFSTRGGTIA